MEKAHARKILEEALRTLTKEDLRLGSFPTDIGERPVVFRLAHYLVLHGAEADDVLRVDCDYNRHLADVKTMLYAKQEAVRLPSGKMVNEKRFFPDIVLHQRQGDDHNILVCEIKRGGDRRDPEIDRRRLAHLTRLGGGYRYKLGAFVLVEPTATRIVVTYFEDGRQSDTITI